MYASDSRLLRVKWALTFKHDGCEWKLVQTTGRKYTSISWLNLGPPVEIFKSWFPESEEILMVSSNLLQLSLQIYEETIRLH